MNGKTVKFGSRPTKPEPAQTPEQWVETRIAPEGTKRLTVEIPASLHARIKSRCAADGRKMTDRVLEILEREFPT